MFEKSIFFIQENDVAYFFSHRYCLLDEHQKPNKNKKSKEVKLRSCCELKIGNIGVI